MRRRLNNQGYLFNVTVIIIIVVSFIITGCLSIVLANWNMKKTEKETQSNFYSTEQVMNDIKAGIEQDCSDAMANAYSIVMNSISTIPYDKLNDEFKKIYLLNLQTLYGDNCSDKISGYIDDKYTSSTLESNPVYDDNNDAEDNKVYIRNIGVAYESLNGIYLNRIYTDIEITVPTIYAGLESSSASETDFTEYILISDTGIELDGSPKSIVGGIYAGTNGITLGKKLNSNITLSVNKLITRGDITVFRPSELKISGLNKNTAQIYAQNLIVSRDNTANTYSEEGTDTAIDITGDVYISGDTLLNAQYGNFKLSGNYFGYGSGTKASDDYSDRLSAFCINALGVDVDMSNVKTLWLAGTSYIDINTATKNSNADVLMGESLTYKGTQSLYLVPSVCITSIDGSETYPNPLSQDYFDNINNSLVLKSDKIKIDLSQNVNNGGINLESYVDTDKPYITVCSSDDFGNNRVYLYLNFKSSSTASDYVSKYASSNQEYMTNRASSFKLGNIILGENTTLKTSGNVITCSVDGNSYNISVITKSTSSSSDYISYRDNYYTSTFNSLASTLQEHKTSTLNDSLFDYLINGESIHEDFLKNSSDGDTNAVVSGTFECKTKAYYKNDIKNGAIDYEVLIADGDVVIQKSFTGLVITNGNIIIGEGVKATGLLLAKGTISSADNALNYELSATFDGDYPVLYLLYEWSDFGTITKYFNTVGTSGNTSFIDNISSQSTIKFTNWVTE
jgi:hypothetical protein